MLHLDHAVNSATSYSLVLDMHCWLALGAASTGAGAFSGCQHMQQPALKDAATHDLCYDEH